MDIQQLRSSIFELYEPLENDRQYIVFDAARGNLIVDVPRYSERAVRLIRGTGPASLIVVTNAGRAREAAKFREALGIQIAAHADDAAAIEGGPDIELSDDALLRPDARAIRVRQDGEGATVVLLRKPGNVLVVGDLDLASPAGRSLLPLECELPKPRKRFGILLDAPWDRAYKGRLEDQMTHFDPIVPREETVGRDAAMGTQTLLVSHPTP